MEKQKSKKDIAFDKERAKYRHEIYALQREIKENLREIEVLNLEILELKESILEKDEWINRLLEYTELTEEDMKKKIQNYKVASEILDSMEKMNYLFSVFGTRFGL